VSPAGFPLRLFTGDVKELQKITRISRRVIGGVVTVKPIDPADRRTQ
jgi:hypothetical protein